MTVSEGHARFGSPRATRLEAERPTDRPRRGAPGRAGVPHERRSELLQVPRRTPDTLPSRPVVIVALHVATGAAAGAASRSRLAALLLGPVLHLAGDRLPHEDFRSTRLRDRNRSRGDPSLARAARPARPGDAWRSGKFRPGPRARPSSAASGWKEALSRPHRVAPRRGPFPAYRTAPAGRRDSRRAHRAPQAMSGSPVRVLLVYAVVDVRSSPTARSVTPTTERYVHAARDELSRAARGS